MRTRIKGITVILNERSGTGRTDPFGREIFAENPVKIDNVLVGEPSTEDVTAELNLSGKHIAYTLAVPKGDTHNWEDSTVEFFGEKFKVIGTPTQGIEANIPLAWNKKVKVERYVCEDKT